MVEIEEKTPASYSLPQGKTECPTRLTTCLRTRQVKAIPVMRELKVRAARLLVMLEP